MFIRLLTNITNASNYKNWVSLSSQKRMIKITLINSHSNQYSQEFHYYPFTFKLDRSVGSCSTLNDFCNKV